jgi:hypothetical protein
MLPCTRLDLAVILLYFQLLIPDKYAKSLNYYYQYMAPTVTT